MYNADKMRLGAISVFLLFVLSLVQPDTASAISVTQVDTFSDGTLQGWEMGRASITASQMSIVPGGPAGTGDNYLQVFSDGSTRAGGRLTFFNQLQWSGDFTAAGITTISMDLNNISSSEALNLRLGLYGGVFDPNTPGSFIGGLYATSASVGLSSGSGWTHVEFSFLASDLVPVSGNSGVTGNNIEVALANVLELRLLNGAAPDWAGVPVIATLGIDNISAAPISTVPLPPAFLLFGSGLVLLGAWRRRCC
jgi:hypothetical protein